MKLYEPAMRHPIDNYIRADGSKVISHLEDISLIDLIESKGASAEDDLPARRHARPACSRGARAGMARCIRGSRQGS
ncbi:hypothetical protein [Roseisalinus antarcticus]|nr:hypothetical protein [Roseisalinus antarcticus]